MTNGIGAGFTSLMLLAVLLGISIVNGVVSLGLVFVRDSRQTVRTVLRHVSGLISVGVVIVAGFTFLFGIYNLPLLTFLVTVIALLPIAVTILRLVRAYGLDPMNAVLVSAGAWSWPYAMGLVIFFGTTIAIPFVFDLAPAMTREYGVAWIASTIAGVIALVGSYLLTDRLATRISADHPA